MGPYDIILYKTEGGKEPYAEWINRLRDRAGIQRIATRIERVAQGHLGDHKSLGDGVFELRLHFGPGYRVYFGRAGEVIILLLCGGDKDTQDRDIALAKSYWADWVSSLERSGE